MIHILQISNYPDIGRCWNIVDKYKISIFYTAPILVRSLMREGDEVSVHLALIFKSFSKVTSNNKENSITLVVYTKSNFNKGHYIFFIISLYLYINNTRLVFFTYKQKYYCLYLKQLIQDNKIQTCFCNILYWIQFINFIYYYKDLRSTIRNPKIFLACD